MLQQKMSTKTSGVHLPPHPTLQSCCGIAAKEQREAAQPCQQLSGTSSTVQGKSLQLRAQYTLGWSTCSRSCGPFAVVTSTRNSRQVALRTTLGLLMQCPTL